MATDAARLGLPGRWAENPGVGGSIPSLPTIHFKQLPTREFLPS
jgi:hypothetical protein